MVVGRGHDLMGGDVLNLGIADVPCQNHNESVVDLTGARRLLAIVGDRVYSDKGVPHRVRPRWG